MREIITNEWFTISLMIGLCVITLCKYLFTNRFEDFLTVLGNSKYLKLHSKDQKFIDGFDTLLFINLVLCVSIFSYISYSTLVETLSFSLFLYAKIVFAVAAIILIKVLIERLLGSLFDIDSMIDNYLFQKMSYKNYIGMLLLPLNAILLYSLTPSKLLIYIVFGILLFINITGFLATFKSYQKLMLSNLFYFILYLCALEIGPYLILYEFVVKK